MRRSYPMWLRKCLSDSVMNRAVRHAVDEHGHQEFILVTREGTDPHTAEFRAVDATAAGQPIYAQDNGQARKKGETRP